MHLKFSYRNNIIIFQILGKFAYSELGGCGRGVAHQTCFTVMAREAGSRSLSVFALEAPSSELAHAICTHIGQYCTAVYCIL